MKRLEADKILGVNSIHSNATIVVLCVGVVRSEVSNNVSGPNTLKPCEDKCSEVIRFGMVAVQLPCDGRHCQLA